MANPRKTAFLVLQKIEQDHAYSNITLNHEIKKDNLDKRDASLASALVYGVLERQLMLDYILEQYMKSSIKKVQCGVLILLRLGALQILFMDKIPNSAAVNETVNLAKKNKLFSSSGFINGVLRALIRSQDGYKLPGINEDKLTYYSITYSCPKEIVLLWLNSYGEELTLQILKGITKPPVFIRVNTLKIKTDCLMKRFDDINITAKKTPLDENALILTNTGAIEELELFKRGFFHVQDIASQLCCKALQAMPNDLVYDVCAAPGGKAFTIAQQMENKGKIKSFDLYEHKINLINQGARRLKIDIIDANVRDALDKSPMPLADKVLCDVPCSGLGILRRKPEIRYKKDFGFSDLPKLQYEILCNSSKLVKPNGILIYSTCTLNAEENNKNADRFLAENPDFEPCAIKLYPPELSDQLRKIEYEPENQLTLFPQENATDGFFISSFVRRG